MLLMNLVDQINSHKWLFLDRLYEEKDLELCVIIGFTMGGIARDAGLSVEEFRKLL